jgi:hypothetical protein
MTAFGSVDGGGDAAGTGARARHSWLASDLGSVTGGRWAKGKGADGTHPVPVAPKQSRPVPQGTSWQIRATSTGNTQQKLAQSESLCIV